MDLDIIQSTKEGEITQFFCDVRDYFKASLATSEYENTSNMFYLTAAERTEQLLNRCECLLNWLKKKNPITPINTEIRDFNDLSPLQASQSNGIRYKGVPDIKNQRSIGVQRNIKEIDNEDVSYLDMSASHLDHDKKPSSFAKIVDLNNSGDSDKTFRCSTFVVRQNKSFLHRLHDTMVTTASDDETDDEEGKSENQRIDANSFEEDAQIYDICQVTTQGSDAEEDEIDLEETQKAMTQDSHFSLPNIDCPYMDLPAGHLSIKKSIKYGQLLKIEKRLFFDQSKKCYCGILNDWLLCYADGPTSNGPTVSLYLKIPSIEIEHFGEGKRRDICFQITTCDPNKRFVFQAINEIDAKEWIHAIEAAIRSDTTGADVRNSGTRKLPTPPLTKKITFLNSVREGTDILSNTISSDCIYEEPSTIHHTTKSSSEKLPELPHKQKNPLKLADKFEYDVPKCPPQPFKDTAENDVLLINPYENNNKKNNSAENTHTITLSESLCLGSSPPSVLKQNLKMEENLDFQAKVKDVHNKLTSQLSNGPNIKKSLKITHAATSENDAEPLSISLTPTLPETADLKKQKKTSNSSNSPQKMTNAKNWFLNRLNKNTSSTRSTSSSPSNSPSKSKQSEKENLLNSISDVCDGMNVSNSGNYPVSPTSKSSSPSIGTSKVNMIINQLEASGHLASMFNVDAIPSFSSFCDNDFNNYEPIMTVSPPSTNLIKKS